ncbi:MAG: carboxypeptidase regulatory-like domain-containing protein [Candidatus Cloacimonadota bacterium]|nr:carboxypeptidase regulatory-like domain-containing protein [Candidatus Cloacimonadota bacterium]
MKTQIIIFLIVFAFIGNVFAMEVLINGVNQATITQGEDFVITINFSSGSSQAATSMWVDMNDNAVWEDNIDLIVPGEGGEIFDNSPEDENPEDGVYEITVSGEEDGPNGVSNLGLFYVAEDSGGLDDGYLWIDPIDSNYSVSGSVTPAAHNVIIMAATENETWMTTTDVSGNYQNFVDPAGEYMLMAFDPINVLGGMISITMYEEVLINGHLSGYDFEFIEGNSTINGYVLDQTGDPVINVTVSASQGGPSGIFNQTDEDGFYELSVIEGNWYVDVSDDDLFPDYMSADHEEIYIEEGATETVDFTVYSTDATITGTVYFDDIPASGYEVNAWNDEIGETEAYSIGNGTYSLSVSSEADALGGYCVNVDIWDVPGIYVEENYNNIISGSTNINFHIYTVTGGIEGQILNANTMQPAEDCWVSANDGTNWFNTGVDEDGYYQLPLPNGTYTVEANGEMYYQQIVEDVEVMDELVQLDFLLDPVQFDGALEGTIYEAGTTIPIENAEVSVGNATYYTNTITNENGYYHFDLPNGSYWVDAWHQNYYSYHNDEVIINYDIVQLDIELEPVVFDGSLEGYVYELDTTTPIPYANIQVGSATYSNNTQADMNGYYYFDLPNEIYSADCWMNGYFGEHIDNIEIANNAVIQDFYLEPDVEADDEEIEVVIGLGQNYPNPFNPTTKISFTTMSIENTELVIYNIKGQKVKTLINSVLENGDHLIIWDGNDQNNQPVSSGVYFYQLKIGNEIIDSKRMLLLK